MDTLAERQDSRIEDTLDPADWGETRAVAHRVMDEAIDYLRDVRHRPPWRPMPAAIRTTFNEPLPQRPMPLAQVCQAVMDDVMTYPMGNVHPRFWSWYMGSGSFTGALGDFLAAVQGSNLGGGDHVAVNMDRQVVDWCKQMVGFPANASGSLESGGSMANLIGLTVARNVMAGVDVREEGVAALPRPLRFYSSDQVHSCHRKALEALGLGHKALRRVPSDEDFRIDLAALRAAIAEDRANGWLPACIIGNAGTVNTGAIDDLEALAGIAAKEGMWLHIDGCIGALVSIAPENGHRVAGVALADSVALDPHKWLHAPFEVGCILVRDEEAHRGSFAVSQEYLEHSPRGIAAGPWLYEYGLQTSRAFRALKVWMAVKHHGIERFGRLIDQNIAQARYLAELVEAEPLLSLMTPVSINIVCFRFGLPGMGEAALKALNVEIMLRLQEQGIAVLSDTTIRDSHCLRVAITNHRTRRADLDLLVRETVRLGRAILKEG